MTIVLLLACGEVASGYETTVPVDKSLPGLPCLHATLYELSIGERGAVHGTV